MTNIPPQGYRALAGSERTPPATARQIGLVDPNERIEVSVYLRAPAPSDLANTIREQTQQQGKPPLTRAEYAASQSAAPADLAKIEEFAREHDLTIVEVDPTSRKVVLAGTAAALTAAFGTQLHLYEEKGITFRGRQGPIHLPSELDQIVVGVFGLDNRPQARPLLRQLDPAMSPPRASAVMTSYTPLQLAQLYDFPTGLDGQGQCIALIELSGGYKLKDLQTYFEQLNLSAPKVISVSVDGQHNNPVGDPNSADGEVVLDIEVAGAIAPGAHIVVYFAPNTDQGFIDAVTQAIHDSINKPSVISISWGNAEINWTKQAMRLMDQAFQAAAALGITVCCAAGDRGSADGVNDGQAHVDFPASSPYALACGGTRLESTNNHITSEEVWNNGPDSATGGGVSEEFDRPSWQDNAGVPPSVNPTHHVGRGVPDVAGNADPQTGYQIYGDGQPAVFGGTSAVAPLWAGLIALLNQQRGHPVFLNPILYQHYQQLLQNNALRNVTSGNNGDYSAGPGWNACTGLGTPDGAKLLTALISAPSQPTKEREEQAREERERVFTPQLLNLGQGSWQSHMYGDRPYYVYTPVNYHVGTAVPLILMLHGCEQLPIDIAYDSRMNELADQQQFVVVYPQHAELRLGDINPMLCWNFFYAENQERGNGEPASLAGIVQAVTQNTLQWTIDRKRIYVAGPSSGGAMTVILGVTYPDLFAAIGVHSGCEYQWAQLPHPIPLSQPAAVGVQVQAPVVTEPPSDARAFFHEGFLSVLPPGPDPIEQGEKAFKAMGSLARVIPTIVFHGTADPFVNPINGDQVVQQWLRTNQLASHGAFTATFDHPSSVTLGQVPGGHSYTVFTWKDAQGSDIIAYWKVDGMGHAWSGGSPGRPFTDPKGPDASEAMYQFFMNHPLP